MATIEVIKRLYHEREGWTDDEILAELTALPIVPDAYLDLSHDWFGAHNPAWDDETVLYNTSLYLALADQVRDRKLRAGVPLLLERAQYGDWHEIMRGLRHRLEATYDLDMDALADVCIAIMKSPNRGARLWAARELGVLRLEKSFPTLVEALSDPAKLVRFHACQSLHMLAQKQIHLRPAVIAALQRAMLENEEVNKHAARAIQDTENL